MVKVFTTNSSGKIEFTKDELEKILNEVWHDGYNSYTSYWWTSPVTIPSITTPFITTPTCGSDSIITTTANL